MGGLYKVNTAICLHTRYGMSGTDLAYGTTRNFLPLSSRGKVGYLPTACYGMSTTNVAYGTARCPVLT
eukprot:3941293-Rhodomonas_salina.1